ncbi:CHAP domain-containing protein [Nonomuraea sp. NPDC059194]|uniref:CHAP domain-containing protein n=1 Tax=Nonomuraea sp. NPDC059194 TaxID=3346764 RepID=UPI003685C8D0
MSLPHMLAAARKSLGLSGRPNYITRDYAKRHGGAFLDAPWCAMSVTYWARLSGNGKAVLPDGDRAYTVWFAEDGRDMGRWHAGTTANIKAHCKPGAVVFMDWDGTDSISRIDHVGIVEKVLPDGRVQTIEGNTGDACKRRVRSASVIAGFWNPPYTGSPPSKPAPKPKPEPNPTEVLVKQLPTLREGDKGWHVKTMHYLLAARDYAIDDSVDDTTFTAYHEQGIRGIQDAAGIKVDGVCGPQTWAALLRVL